MKNPFEDKTKQNIYDLYKRIMKHDTNAIDEIESLEEAKNIIKMIAGNIYLDGKIYNMIDSLNENKDKI